MVKSKLMQFCLYSDTLTNGNKCVKMHICKYSSVVMPSGHMMENTCDVYVRFIHDVSVKVRVCVD